MFGGFFCGFAALGNPLLGFPRPTFHWKLGLPSLRFADAKEFRSLRGAPSRLRQLDTRQRALGPLETLPFKARAAHLHLVKLVLSRIGGGSLPPVKSWHSYSAPRFTS